MELKDKKIVSVPDLGKFLNLRRTPTNDSLVLRKSRGVRPSFCLPFFFTFLWLFHDSQLRMQRQSRRKPRGKQKGW